MAAAFKDLVNRLKFYRATHKAVIAGAADFVKVVENTAAITGLLRPDYYCVCRCIPAERASRHNQLD